MATNYRIENVVLRTSIPDASRLLFLNRLEEYVVVLNDSREILQILRSYHDPCAGNFLAEITLRKVIYKFYWPTMKKDIFEYVKACGTC